METIVLNIRMPRIIMACLVGCCLASAGACYQGVFQNPMAAPDLLGASTGACFGAALAILYGRSSAVITLYAFFFSLLTVLLVFVIGQRAPGQKTVNLILAGIMVSSLFSAGTSYIKLVADPGSKLPEITYWLMGSLTSVKARDARTGRQHRRSAAHRRHLRHAGHRRRRFGQRSHWLGRAGHSPPVPPLHRQRLPQAAARLDAVRGDLPAAGG